MRRWWDIFFALLWESLPKVQLDFSLWRGLCTLSLKVLRRWLLHCNLENDDCYDASSCNLHWLTLALSRCKRTSEQFFSWLCFFVISLVGTSDSLTSSEFSYSGEDRQDNELPPQDTRTQWEVGELSPGSYCRYKYYPLESEQRASDWNPKASKGIVVRKGTTTWFKRGYFLATAEVAEESASRKPSIFYFEITAVIVNVVNYICRFCCLSFEIWRIRLS